MITKQKCRGGLQLQYVLTAEQRPGVKVSSFTKTERDYSDVRCSQT